MGTLTNFRKISPYALGLFAIIFIAFMVLSDADFSNLIRQGQSLQNASVGSVNGEKILYKDYEDKVRTQIEQERAQAKDADQEIDEARIRQTVWSQMVDNILINQEAKKMGISVTPEEIRDELIENPPDYLKRSFTDSTGNFMRDIYLELVTKPETYAKYLGNASEADKQAAIDRLRKDLIEVEDYIRKTKLFNTIQKTVGSASSFISNDFAIEKYKGENSTADVKVIALRTNLIKRDNITVSDNEIKKYYDDHKQYYEQKNETRIKYLNFQIKPSEDDSARAARHLKDIAVGLIQAQTDAAKDSIFDIKLSEFGGTTTDYVPYNQVDANIQKMVDTLKDGQIIGPYPGQNGMTYYRLDGKRTGTNVLVKASHILIKFNDNKDSALAVANEILKEARSGKDFAELAKTKSEDKGSAVNGGDLGFFGKGQMVKPFEEAAFAANVGQIVGPVESQFGYHIIKVTDKNSMEVKYSTISIAPTVSNATKNSLFRDAFSFSKQLEAGENFDTLAARLKKQAAETPYFTNERPVFNSWYLTDKAFDLEVGKVIEPIELKYYGIMVCQVSGKKSAGIVSLEDKREEIKNILIKRKQLDMLKDQATNLYNKVKGLADLSEAKSMDTTLNVIVAVGQKENAVIPGLAKDVALTTKIFSSNGNGIIGPIRGENGYYVVQVSNLVVPQDAEIKSKIKDYTKSLISSATQNAFYQWYQKIKDNAEIKDKRADFYKDF